MSTESKSINVDPDIHKAIKVFSRLNDETLAGFVRRVVIDHLNREYGEEFTGKYFQETNPIAVMTLITAQELKNGKPIEKTLLGSLIAEPK